jgi:transcriptional regulator with XRE-family HTH domain
MAARKRAGLTQTQLAEKVGVEQGTVARWENGTISVTTKRLRLIAEATGVALAELMDPGAAPTPESRAALALAMPPTEFAQPISALPRDLPVLGSVLAADLQIDNNGQCLSVERLELGLFDIIEHVRRPLAFARNAGAYALYVTGASMEPRYDAGDMIYVDPRRPPSRGDDVVVQLRGGDDQAEGIICAMIKRLVRQSSTIVELEQYNPPLRFTLPMAQVAEIHRVARLGELLGR